MAIIVQDVKTNVRHVLVGTGFGATSSAVPSAVLGNLAPKRESTEFPLVCVCSAYGTIQWLPSDSVRVVSVDGQEPQDLLAG